MGRWVAEGEARPMSVITLKKSEDFIAFAKVRELSEVFIESGSSGTTFTAATKAGDQVTYAYRPLPDRGSWGMDENRRWLYKRPFTRAELVEALIEDGAVGDLHKLRAVKLSKLQSVITSGAADDEEVTERQQQKAEAGTFSFTLPNDAVFSRYDCVAYIDTAYRAGVKFRLYGTARPQPDVVAETTESLKKLKGVALYAGAIVVMVAS